MPKPTSSNLYNLLDDALVGVEDGTGRRESVSLPGLLARLSQGVPTTLAALQAHQQHAVHAFLVQLAAIALSRAGEREIEHDESAWKRFLLNAAERDGAGAEAFTLVVEDLSKPAFLQPPVPEGKLVALKNEHELPTGDLDVLITAKNHDVKIDRIDRPTVEHWIFALITLQTMQGFLGAGNYGIARMKDVFSSRPCVTYASGLSEAERFRRDVRILLEQRDALIEDYGFAQRGELGLIWCKPWDGTTSLAFDELDPFFIEICRRIRLTVGKDGKLVAYRGTSKVARIDAKASNGVTGDPWTPIEISRKDEAKALTATEAGFHYTLVHDLLFDEKFRAGIAGKTYDATRDRYWLGQVLVRGRGKTGGYHERWVPIPPKARRQLARSAERERLGKRSREWVDFAGTARPRVLKPALLTLLQGGPEQLKFDDNRVDHHLQRFDDAIDGEFFHLLFEQADNDSTEANAAFQKRLVELARAELDEAAQSLPIPAARRWRARALAERAFDGACRNHLKFAFPPKPTPNNEVSTIGDAP